MAATLRGWFVLVFMASFSCQVVTAKEKKAPPRKDRHGDELPPGALARLGTVRFHHPEPIHTVAFTPDGQALLVFAHRYKESALRLWNITDGTELASFDRKDDKYADAWYTRGLAFTPDGKGIVLRREESVELIDRQSGKTTHVLEAKSKFHGMALSPNGKVVALAAKEDKSTTITFWEMATGKSLPPLTLETDWFFGLHWSSDAKRLLTASRDKKERSIVQVWDLDSRKKLHEVEVDNYFYVAFTRDGRTLATQVDRRWNFKEGDKKDDGEIRLVRIADGATLSRLKPPPNGAFHSFAFTPDGKGLITIAPGQTPWLWDAATGKRIRAFGGPPASSQSMGAFSADGKRFALIVGSHYRENAVRLWNVDTGAEIRPYDGHADEVTAVAFAPDGKLLASGSWDRTVRLWDPKSGRELRCLEGHRERVLALAFSPDGGTLASASTDGTTRLWRVVDGVELLKLDGPGKPGAKRQSSFEREGMRLVFSADGKTLYAVDDVEGYCAWDVAGKRAVKSAPIGDKGTQWIGLSPDGRTALGYWPMHFDEDRTREALGLWNPADGKRERSFPRRPSDGNSHDMACVAAEFSRDGRLLASSSRRYTYFEFNRSVLYGDPALRIWERLSGQEILSIDAYPKTLAFSPDGKLIAGNQAGSDPKGYDLVFHEHMGSVYLWDTTTGKSRLELGSHTAEVRCLAFAPDGKSIASGSAGHTVIIWDCSSVLAKAKPLPEPAAKQLDAWWDSLADAKATSARHAMADLIAHPAAATRLLADRLKPDVAPDPKHVATLIRDLGDANFATRQRATDALVQLGDLALPALRKAQIADPDLETKRRLEVTISKATDVGYRKARAVAVLESIGDPVAARVLETLAKGITESRQTVEARQSLRRLGK